jgi:hypothetical protein
MSSVPVPEQARPALWSGPLSQLIHTLTGEAARLPAGTWVSRRLGRGAVVALKFRGDNRRVLQLWRPYGPMADTVQRDKAWLGEVNTFLAYFRTAHWEPVDTRTWPESRHLGPGMLAVFREPSPVDLQQQQPLPPKEDHDDDQPQDG